MTEFMRRLLECTIVMSALSVFLLLLMPALSKRYRARSLHIVWIVVLVGFLIPFRPHIAPAAITVNVPRAQPVWQAAQTVVTDLVQTPDIAQRDETPNMEAQAKPATAPAPSSAAPKTPFPVSAVLFAVWLAGALLSLGCRATRHRAFLRTVRRWSRADIRPEHLGPLNSIKAELGIRREVALRLCRAVDSPMLIGLFRPTILLPDRQFSKEALALVLRHELIHCRRGDLWAQALTLAASAMHWFNPLLPFVAREAAFQCEAACDAEVMRGEDFEGRRLYSQTILHMLRRRMRVATALSTRYHGGKRTMKQRILRILDTGRKRFGALLIAATALGVLAAGMAFALATETPVNYMDEIVRQYSGQQNAQGFYDAAPVRHAIVGRVGALLERLGDQFSETERQQGYIPLSTSVEILENPNEIYDRIDACATKAEFDLLVREIPLSRFTRRENIERFAQEALAVANYPALPYLAYHQITKYDPYHQDGWLVLACGEQPADGKPPVMTTLFLSEDGKIQGISDWVVPYYGRMTPVSAAQKAYARERAEAFIRGHANIALPPEPVSYVSDYVFAGHRGEPHTLVWLQSADEAGNMGVMVTVGVETGLIYQMSPEVEATSFVNTALAGEDWTAQTGEAYPVENAGYFLEVVNPYMSQRASELREQFKGQLSAEDDFRITNLVRVFHNEFTYEHADWRPLAEALRACGSADALGKLARGAYPGINRPMPGDPPFEQMDAQVERMLLATGFSPEPYRAYTWMPEAFGVEATVDEGVTNGTMNISAIVNGHGMLTGFYTYCTEAEPLIDVAGEPVDVEARALAFVRAYVENGAEADAVKVLQTYPDPERGGTVASVMVYRSDGKTMRNPSEPDDQLRQSPPVYSVNILVYEKGGMIVGMSYI